MTLFKHTIDGLVENAEMNGLSNLFEGFDSASEALELYGETFAGDTYGQELEATIKALNELFEAGVDNIEHSAAQKIIEEWNIEIWGVDFAHNGCSVPV